MKNVDVIRRATAVVLSCGAIAGLGGLTFLETTKALDDTPAVPSCYDPSRREIRDVAHLFAKPPAAPEIPLTYVPGGPNPPTPEDEAAKDGLTLPDNSLHERALMLDVYKGSTDVFFRVARQYLEQFGVQLIIPQKSNIPRGGGHIPTDGELNTVNARIQIARIMDGFHGLPLQYVGFSGLKKILLVADIPSPAKYEYAAEAFTHGQHDVVAVDITRNGDATTIDHEIYHEIDAAECGAMGMHNDTGFTDLNPNNIYLHRKWKQAEKRRAVTMDGTLVTDQANIFTAEPGHVCGLISQFERDEARAVAVSDYSLDSPTEDKAEMGAIFARPYKYDLVLDPSRPIIKRKFEFLMARLYHFRPRLVRYFAAVSDRPTQSLFDAVDCGD